MTELQEKQSLTYGQRRVGVNFNPSQKPEVLSTKTQAAAQIDYLETLRNEQNDYVITAAQLKIEEACMWVVKALTA